MAHLNHDAERGDSANVTQSLQILGTSPENALLGAKIVQGADISWG
jgi:hypothetical protein